MWQMQWYSIAFWVVYCNWFSIIMCGFCVHHHVRIPTNVSEVHGSMILYSFFTWKSLDPGGSHCIPSYIGGSLDPRTHWPGGQWFLGYGDRGSINPRTEWPGGHSMRGSLKPTTPLLYTVVWDHVRCFLSAPFRRYVDMYYLWYK